MSKYDYYKFHDYSKFGDYFEIPSYQDFNYKKRKIAPSLIEEDDLEKENSIFGIKEKIENLKTKRALSKMKDIIINELKKDYYKNAGNVSEFVDINTHFVENTDRSEYYHVENMVIWQNGFYNFNSFNLTTPSMKKVKKI